MENQWSNNIRNFARQTLQEWRDIADAIADVLRWIGRGFLAVHYRIDGAICALFEPKDPARFAQKPPDWWHYKTPTAAVPTQPKRTNEVELDVWTDEEVAAMSEAEYRTKIGLTGVMPYDEAVKQARKRIAKKGNAKEV